MPRTPLNTRQDCDAVDLVAPHGFGFVSELVSLTRPCRAAITQCAASVSGSSAHQLFRPRCQLFSDDPESLANNSPQCSRRNPRPHYGGTRTAVSAEDLKEAVMSKTWTIYAPYPPRTPGSYSTSSYSWHTATTVHGSIAPGMRRHGDHRYAYGLPGLPKIYSLEIRQWAFRAHPLLHPTRPYPLLCRRPS